MNNYSLITPTGPTNNTPMNMQHHAPMPMQAPPGLHLLPQPSHLSKARSKLADMYDSDDGSDSDSDSDSDDSGWGDSGSKGDYMHYYGILTIILLIAILYFQFQIKKELTGMFE